MRLSRTQLVKGGGLLHAGTLCWQELVERGLPLSALWDLASVIHLLFSKAEVKDQTTSSMLTILEELTGILLQCFSKVLLSHMQINKY